MNELKRKVNGNRSYKDRLLRSEKENKLLKKKIAAFIVNTDGIVAVALLLAQKIK